MNKKTKVIHMVTSPRSIRLMEGQLSYLVNSGFDVTVIASHGIELNEAIEKENVKIKAINMERTISPLRDLISLISVIFYFIKVKPDICNAGTPKAGLLGMIAARLTRVPYKVYTNRGLPFEGSNGFKRKILMLMERVACACADKIICISPSVERKVIEFNLTSKNKTVVFGEGSSNGLQIDKFEDSDEIQQKVMQIRKEMSLSNYNFIIGYVGRINNFKGVKELVIAFEKLQKKYNNITLLLIGTKEKKDPISDETNRKIINNPHIKEVGRVNNPIPYYYLMDVLAFPTYREGFGNVSIEAQATGTPVVTTNATGSIDTVVHNETGYIVNVGETVGLEKAIEEFINKPYLIKEMGEKGKNRVRDKFDSKITWEGLKLLYRTGLGIK